MGLVKIVDVVNSEEEEEAVPTQPPAPPQKRPLLEFVLMVKNGATTVEATIDTLGSSVDHYTILDTGSTDGTQQKIRDRFAHYGVPGTVYEEPFINFCTSRNRALQLARNRCVFTLMLDDSYLLSDAVALRAYLETRRDTTETGFSLMILFGTMKYAQPWIIRTQVENSYYDAVDRALQVIKNSVGHIEPDALQEVLSSTIQEISARAGVPRYHFEVHETITPGFAHIVPSETCLITDKSTPETVERSRARHTQDAKILLDVVTRKRPHCTRSMYYLAQSYNCIGNVELAYQWFETRARQTTGYSQEVYISLMSQYYIATGTVYKKPEGWTWITHALPLLMRAVENDGDRIEALYELGKHYMHASLEKDRNLDLAIMWLELGMKKRLLPFDHKLFNNMEIRNYELPEAYIRSTCWVPAETQKGMIELNTLLAVQLTEPKPLNDVRIKQLLYLKTAASKILESRYKTLTVQ